MDGPRALEKGRIERERIDGTDSDDLGGSGVDTVTGGPGNDELRGH
jgi:hypothetical protein